jgi:metallo-beta-lactamase family protein
MITLTVGSDGEKRTILFSGDVGRRNTPIIHDPTVFDRADYVLVESTYGNRLHESHADVAEKMAQAVLGARRAGGNLLIPSFALERAQHVMYYFNELLRADRIPHLMVFLDSPMAIGITEVFRNHPEMYDAEMAERVRREADPFGFPGLKMTVTTAESKAINQIKGTVAVIAGSGMCTGGRIKHHLVNNISRRECTILFVGYQAAGTLGRLIQDGAEEVRILGRMLPVRANVVRIHGFSAHADRDELFAWLTGLTAPPRGVFVVHGESASARQFGGYVREKTGWHVLVPEYLDEAVLD